MPPRHWKHLGVLLFCTVAIAIGLRVVADLKPASALAFTLFATWLVAPTACLGLGLFHRLRKGRPDPDHAVAVALATAAGLLGLFEIVYWHPDPQGALALLLVPPFQGLVFAFLLPLLRRYRKARAGP